MERQEERQTEGRRGFTLDDQIVGVPWFEKKEWAAWQKLCVSQGVTEKSYKVWRKENKAVMSSIRSAGIRARKISIDVGRFEQWCRRCGCPCTSASLAGFVNACLGDLTRSNRLSPEKGWRR